MIISSKLKIVNCAENEKIQSVLLHRLKSGWLLFWMNFYHKNCVFKVIIDLQSKHFVN